MTYSSLPAAISAAIAHGNSYTDIKPDLWSKTYGDCGVEAIKSEWERQEWARTQHPTNSYEVEGK